MTHSHGAGGGGGGSGGAAMDSRVGLDFIVENPEYIGKLAAALDTPSTQVKKQVFELLSALCVYNEEGYQRTIDTLECYKKLKGSRYRLQMIVSELEKATAVDYRTALVAFVNCLIISKPRLQDRVRLRNEFIALNLRRSTEALTITNHTEQMTTISDIQGTNNLGKGSGLLGVLNRLRAVAESEPDLAVQLDVFDEQKESDDQQSLIKGSHGGLDLNSPLDVFYAILRQVADTPQEVPFLSILQHFLRIDPKEPISDMVWDTAERLVHRATLLEDREDAVRLLRAPSTTKFTPYQCSHCHRGSLTDQGSPSRKQSLATNNMAPPPPPPPPPIARLETSCPPPPPPSGPVPPPPMLKPTTAPTLPVSPTCTDAPESPEKLPQQETPIPKIKMKTINWNKIPSHKVVGKNNIWSLVADNHQHSPMTDMDWSEMEGLFCQQVPATSSAQSSPKLGRDPTMRVRKDNSEVTLLDGKRSLNVNIFLKQFRSSNEDIIQLIKDGEHDDVGAEKLRGLLKILPEVDELDMLKSYNGDFDKLGNAEKFLLQLTSLSNYKLRIESMLLKEEFASNMGYLEPSIQAMMVAGEGLMTNKALQEVLYMVLVAGNFLNSGGYAGNAAGVKLTSLQKITDIRANKPNMNLIHFVALQAEKKNRNLLSFPDSLTVLEDASKTTVEQLQNEINTLEIRIKKIKKVIELPSTESEIKTQMADFLMMAERQVEILQRDMSNLEETRKSLADFFCEDSTVFKLEECFRVFHGFCVRFRQAVVENARRRMQEEQANARRKQREEMVAAKRRQMNSLAGTPVSDCEGSFPDITFLDKKKKNQNGTGTSEDDTSMPPSPCVSRRRIGSFNGQGDAGTSSVSGKEERSPDITPNGSLRRRRSRVLSEEDEGNLMEFLRASGHDTSNRERKSWGSLDRSWARRARGSGTRKRPALLSADFSIDRERPNSPSPLLETRSIVSEESNDPTPSTTSKPREWRQKIESWLRDSESDHQSDRQSRRTINRRSLEMDSESERSQTLDTLHEGKLVNSGAAAGSYKRVYPDWKPSTTIDKTDVVGTLEVIEDAQPQVKDKSAWRKSTLNVPNSSEEAGIESARQRHMVPRPSELPHKMQQTQPNYSEDNTRKGLINALGDRPASDRLTLYMRKADDKQATTIRSPTTPEHRQISNKIEIDSDNIETPPATRRVFSPTPTDKREPTPPSQCKRMLPRPIRETPPSPDDPEPPGAVLGDGQFDRFSSARRTRRYKRAAEVNGDTISPELVAEKEIIRPNQLQVQASYPVATETSTSNDKDSRLKQWQDRLKGSGEPSPTKSRIRNQTGINQDDVRAALKLAKAIPELNRYEKIENPAKPTKTKEHDNDEGFEETQSLMSESPSQGTSSGCTYETDLIDGDYSKNRPTRTSSLESKCTVDSTASSETPVIKEAREITKPTPKPQSEKMQTLMQRYSKGFERSNSVRHSNDDTSRKSVIPRRSASMRKTDSQASVAIQRKNNVERSNSRASLVSSRSSLNSATSTNTIKKMPLKSTTNATKQPVAKPMTIKKPINNILQPKSSSTGLKRVPSGSLSNQKPPRPNSSPAFMKPTTSSTTKTNATNTASRLHTPSFRSVPFK